AAAKSAYLDRDPLYRARHRTDRLIGCKAFAGLAIDEAVGFSKQGVVLRRREPTPSLDDLLGDGFAELLRRADDKAPVGRRVSSTHPIRQVGQRLPLGVVERRRSCEFREAHASSMLDPGARRAAHRAPTRPPYPRREGCG